MALFSIFLWKTYGGICLHLKKSHLVSFLFCSVRVGVEARLVVGLVVRARDLTLVFRAHGCVRDQVQGCYVTCEVFT